MLRSVSRGQIGGQRRSQPVGGAFYLIANLQYGFASIFFLKGEKMIAVGKEAPDFSLQDQFGRTVTLKQFKGKQHTLLLFYPLDFTPT